MTTQSRIHTWDLASVATIRDSLTRSYNEAYYTERMYRITADQTPDTKPDLAERRMQCAQAARGYAEKVANAKYLLDQLEDLLDQIAGVDLTYHPIRD